MPKNRPLPIVPYVEATYQGKKQKPSLIVLDATFTTTSKGAALAVANLWHRPSAPENASHYVIDESISIRCVKDHFRAGRNEWLPRSLSVTICDDPSLPSSRWQTKAHRATMDKATDLVAQLCIAYRIPARFLSDVQLLRWNRWRSSSRGGIVLTSNLKRLLGHGALWDLGVWPQDVFLALVHDKIQRSDISNRLKRKLTPSIKKQGR